MHSAALDHSSLQPEKTTFFGHGKEAAKKA
jgi:hypothetical protein